jgi:hypothetical protein
MEQVQIERPTFPPHLNFIGEPFDNYLTTWKSTYPTGRLDSFHHNEEDDNPREEQTQNDPPFGTPWGLNVG